MEFIFFAIVHLSIFGTIIFSLFAFIQFLFPKFNMVYFVAICYAIGSVICAYLGGVQLFIFSSILALIALLAVLTVRFYRYMFRLMEQKAKEWKEINTL
ncbi:hypothetical protein [Sutcliffiella rhizosphaerae]|uniref:Uncharacterized protein n=1 Tax=Sutcliffiella rhizosphaerae TaxID=2880967 RepID=A0ABN8AA30_9BACI|nr:hypothetical protein [Sutcliffiella rhizosphaerae]CAG9622051.1 hypothetical protein BACCIP111883_02842 [Sutcliffiella rhizosphaerae]